MALFATYLRFVFILNQDLIDNLPPESALVIILVSFICFSITLL